VETGRLGGEEYCSVSIGVDSVGRGAETAAGDTGKVGLHCSGDELVTCGGEIACSGFFGCSSTVANSGRVKALGSA